MFLPFLVCFSNPTVLNFVFIFHFYKKVLSHTEIYTWNKWPSFDYFCTLLKHVMFWDFPFTHYDFEIYPCCRCTCRSSVWLLYNVLLHVETTTYISGLELMVFMFLFLKIKKKSLRILNRKEFNMGIWGLSSCLKDLGREGQRVRWALRKSEKLLPLISAACISEMGCFQESYQCPWQNPISIPYWRALICLQLLEINDFSFFAFLIS